MDQSILYEKYLNSIYARSNSLTNNEYENASEEYDKLYGKYLSHNRKQKILDIGCGTGHFLYYLKKKGLKDYIGIDISEQQIKFCKSKITKKVEKADIFDYLKKNEKKYNFILANDFLEHIKHDKVYEFLNLVYQSLKNGGIFTLRVPNMSNPFSIDSRYRDFTHLTGFTEKSLYQILYIIGFRDIRVESSKIRIKSIKSLIRKLIVLCLHKIIKFFYYIQDFAVPNTLGKNLIVICKKK
jgi:cyclopropane fatty-acyl-phospholipid synthase-like methyltransferase